MEPQFQSKVAIVTGGSRGIGLAIAGDLARAGASVAITGLTSSHLQTARSSLAEIAGSDVHVEAMQADVSDPEQAALVKRVIERFGGLDILINNAGVGDFAPVADMSADTWSRVIGTNLSGVFYCCHAAIPAMRARGAGWIINISSLAGYNAFPGGSAYCASKAGLNAFSEVLMQEVRHDGIRVSYVMPGSVRTRFSGGGDDPGTEWKLAPEDVSQVVMDLLAHHPRSLPSRVELRPSRPPRK